ncbi:MAG: HisS family protein [Candidatus Pacearchaeota archaeon]|nr:HisS family protein [Candidatus Pacearchaeota archaeon]
MSEIKETVKGFRDFTGEEAIKREFIKQLLIKKFKTYGFLPAETPIIEFEEFVKGQNSQDEAISDVFKLKDKGNRDLALRYEFTFQLKRIAQNQKLPFKRYQIGEVFRDEPVSANRFRQFTQCDVDTVGSTLREEAEILKLMSEIFKELKIPAEILINNRKLLNEILDSEKIKEKEQVIREIDKLDKLSEAEVKENLKKYGAEKTIAIFKKPESYFSKFKAYEEIKKLKDFCKLFDVEVTFSSTLARGLSYYNSSVFEIKLKGIKESIAGGGSYLCNGNQSTGISFSLERLIPLVPLAKSETQSTKCVLISINQEEKSIETAQLLRESEISCVILEKISKALEYANSQSIPFVLFIGEEEIKKKKFKLRDMKSGKEEFLGEKELVKKLS